MPVTETIERLAAPEGRLPGTDADRKATDYIAAQLEEAGRKVEVDQIRVRSDHLFAHAICALLAVVGCVLSVKIAPLGVIVLLAATAAMYLDVTARLYSFRMLLPRRSTRNLTSPGENVEARSRLVLTAHHDGARTGLLYARFGGRLPGLLGRVAGPLDVVFWTIATALVLAALRVLLGDSGPLTTLAFLIAIVLLVEALLLVDAGLSAPSPGASDNASGVAATLEIARRLDAEPTPNLDVWIVFPAAKEGLMLGMREWMRKRASQLKRQTNFFVNIDTVGNGQVRYVTAEGFVAAYEHEPEMVDLCAKLAATGDVGAKPHLWRLGTDGVLPAMKGHPSITICCLDDQDRAPGFHTASDTPDNVDPAAVERAVAFTERLIRRIDADLSPRLKRQEVKEAAG